jgi:CubicO group peptidase (beta-lactamase class C family)
MMQLVDSKKVALDAPVQTYLPWFTLGDGRITVRHLLNHTSGISKDLGQDALISNDSSDDALERQARKTIGAQLAHAPGTTYEYSNINYEIAGLIIQKVAGESFESYMQHSIFTPLDMQCSYTSKVEAQQNGVAEGYHYWFGLPFPAGNTPLPRQKVPSGFMAICAEDMAHTLIMHLNNGKYHGVQVVSAAGIAELHRPALDNYAMGWVQNSNGVLEHGGATSDFGSGIIFDPRHNLGVVVLYNIGNAVGTQPLAVLHWNVLNLLTGSILAEPPSNQIYWFVLAGMLVFLLAAVAWTIGSRAWMNRWKKQPNKRPKGLWLLIALTVPLVFELGIPAVMYYQVTSITYGFRNILLHQPDITILFLVFALLVSVNSASRTITAIQLCSQKANA